MAKYRISQPTVISVDPRQPQYIEASHGSPVVVEVPDDYPPSRSWECVDYAAAARMTKLTGKPAGVHVPGPQAPAVRESVRINDDGRAERTEGAPSAEGGAE